MVQNDGLSGLRTREEGWSPEGLPFGAGLGRREAQPPEAAAAGFAHGVSD